MDEGTELRLFLHARDVACPSCGYNLRGLGGALCPECNQQLVLRVGLVEPRIGKLIAALCGVLAAGGGCFAALVVAAVSTARWGPPQAGIRFAVFGLTSVGVVLNAALAVALGSPRGRLWFRKLSARGSWMVIALSWLSPIAFVGWFLALVL